MLPPEITLVHGPGCPVCVTPLTQIDRALAIAQRPERDLHVLRRHAPRARLDDGPPDGQGEGRRRADGLLAARRGHASRSRTRDARSSSSRSASRRRRRRTPWRSSARRRSASRTSPILASHVLVPPAMEAILSSPGTACRAFLLAGHVCTVMGWTEYEPLAERYRIPMIVTGFEPLDLLQGIFMAVDALEDGRFGVENQYVRTVSREGNPAAPRRRERGLRDVRPRVARHRRDPEERLPPAGPSSRPTTRR